VPAEALEEVPAADAAELVSAALAPPDVAAADPEMVAAAAAAAGALPDAPEPTFVDAAAGSLAADAAAGSRAAVAEALPDAPVSAFVVASALDVELCAFDGTDAVSPRLFAAFVSPGSLSLSVGLDAISGVAVSP
jgi:hypothetical protein